MEARYWILDTGFWMPDTQTCKVITILNIQYLVSRSIKKLTTLTFSI
jgi:hypothetical protein